MEGKKKGGGGKAGQRAADAGSRAKAEGGRGGKSVEKGGRRAAERPTDAGGSRGERDSAAGRPVKRAGTGSRGGSGKAAAKGTASRAKDATGERASRAKAVAGKGRGRQAKAVNAGTESTEERIKQAARKLFTQNGFAATRTRDIAREAGINLALLNYYFRSKQKLFDLIMLENFRKFLSGMTVNFQDPSMRMEDRLQRIVTAYVDFLTEFPDLPLFILNEIKGNPSKIADQIRQEVGPARSAFFKELQEAKNDGRIELDPAHFVINLVGLTVFPFVARPLLLRVTGVSDAQFLELMEERKKLVPTWIMMMMKMPMEPGSKK